MTKAAKLPPMRQPYPVTRQVSSPDETTFQNANRILTLALIMREALATRTHDRRWRNLRVYRQCFLHSDAVEWMTEYLLSAPPQPSTDDGDDGNDDGGGGDGGELAPEVTTSRSGDLELRAIAKLNEMIDAGYVHHVCNEHRFVPSADRPTTLYFRFHDDVINADVKSIRRRREVLGELYGGVSEILNEETAALKMAVDRLSTTVDKFSHQLDDAHGRILVLEEAIASLSFAVGVVIYVAAAIALYGAIRRHLRGDGDDTIVNAVLIGAYSVTILLLTANWSLKGPNNISSAIVEHIVVLLKLMRLSTDVEEAFNEAIGENETVDYSSSVRRTSSSSSIATDEQAKPAGVPREVIRKRSSSVILDSVRRVLSREGSVSAKLSIKPVPSIRMRDHKTLPDVSDWSHRPIFVCANVDAQPDLVVPDFGTGACPLGVPFKFSSDLFEGTCLIRLRDVPSDDPDGDAEYFFGRRRKFQAIVQGKFKEELRVDQVLTGHEFVRPLQRLPPSWVVHAGVNLIKRLAPGADIVLHDGQPRALAILAATSQTLSADMPGNEPDITGNEIEEDASLFGGMFSSSSNAGGVTAARRKRHLAAPNRAAQYTYDTESVYTFDFYQNLLDTATYSLDLGFTKLGMHRNLDGQPIQVLSKTVDGRYLWSFQIWHEKLLPQKKSKQA